MPCEKEDTCMPYKEEDTCMSYEEEDSYMRRRISTWQVHEPFTKPKCVSECVSVYI
jgi:hypothetical protein